MRLSKIKLIGFKSFVDPTTFNLPSNLVGIVGPNGCGKSNIIDAVRWVMGETSAKHLRGDSMADVVFNGSTSRKPVGQASIELVFDNSEGRLGGEYAQYAEISVKRQVSRDGQSNYYLNGVKCRRKDITDIFLGTGLGPRSYAIIEQGMISRLIEAKPDELRIFIEEAAGISKYKERRKETETRIRHARDNIARLNDLRDELEKRLETLQRQAKAAERYKELKEEERQLKGQLLALRWRNLNSEAEEQEKSLRRQETQLEAIVAEMRKLEAQLESLRESQVEANEHFNEVQGKYYSIGAEIARLEQAIQHAKDTKAQQEKELQDIETAWRSAVDHIANDKATIESLENNLQVDDQALAEAQAKEKASSEALDTCDAQMQDWQQHWDDFNHRAAEQMRRAEVERARIEHLDQQMLTGQNQIERLTTELRGINPQPQEAELQNLETNLSAARVKRDELDESSRRVQTLMTEAKSQLEREQRDDKALRQRQQNLREQLASVEALQKEALRQQDNKLQPWLVQRGLDQLPRLAQQLSVETGWETAVETVLGHHLQAVCVDDLAQWSGVTDLGNAVSVELVQGGASEPLTEAADDSLARFVRGPAVLRNWLANVRTANDGASAVAMLATLAPQESVVTPDGCWLGPGWLRLNRGAQAANSVLAREKLRQALVAERDTLETDLRKRAAVLEELQERLMELEEERDTLFRTRDIHNRDLARIEAEFTAKQARLDSLHNRIQRLEQDINNLRDSAGGTESEIKQARARLHEALAATEGHDQARQQLLEQRDGRRLQLEDARRQARNDREVVHQIELRCSAQRTQLKATRDSLARTEQQMTHLTRRREELTAALSGGTGPIADMAEQLKEQLNKRLQIEETLLEARRTVESIDHSMRERNQERSSAEQRIFEQKDAINRLQMQWQESRVRCQTLLEQLQEAQFDLNTLVQQLAPDSQAEVWEQEIERIGRSIQRLGPINLAAIDEYTEQSERKTYLDAQYEDLSQGLSTLEQAIQKIDRETRSRFKETFDKVNAGLQEKFPRLFGGGQAYLELTGEDLLETGVTIMARPPGKRNSTIHLLSGGEKALTAVAMVFSIFELNPAPFCMLDEVDAPLDDANVGRFCQLVKEMSSRVQFIYITHNKVTMEMANQLTGVTMHEPGVSRLVAVDVDQAVELATSAA